MSTGFLDWTYSGVDPNLPGNGGIACRDFLGLSQRCWESAAASAVAILALCLAYPRASLPRAVNISQADPPGKRLLLLLMCMTFGIEIGFKLATKQLIWIGNPCHLATMVQIYILSAPPSRYVTAAFRLHMHMLTGAPLAILFPVINTRFLPGETEVYFIQHILMLIIPFYLMSIGDPYIPEDLLDFNWAMLSFGFLFLYHFLPLQLLAYLSQVNLNNMLCPAVSDPFHGQYYRLFAIGHQVILIPLQGKLLVVLARMFGWLHEEQNTEVNYDNNSNNYDLNENTSCSETSISESFSSHRSVSQHSSIADTTKSSDAYEDSGFLGTGCALDSQESDSSPLSDIIFQPGKQFNNQFRAGHQHRDVGDRSNQQTLTAVKRLVNGKIVDNDDTASGEGCVLTSQKKPSKRD